MQQNNNFFKKIAALIDPAGAKKYITQISLLLVSLMIATSADRCRTRQKEVVKLREYLAAIKDDLKEEVETCRMNMNDCARDMKCLRMVIKYSDYAQPDSIRYGFEYFLEVYQRGVFRTFPPTTFEMMMQAGDVYLIKDLALRSELASAFTFVNRNIRDDLESFNQETDKCAAVAGNYIDFSSNLFEDMSIYPRPTKGDMRWSNAVCALLANTNVRKFHLVNSIENLTEALKKLEAYELTLQ